MKEVCRTADSHRCKFISTAKWSAISVSDDQGIAGSSSTYDHRWTSGNGFHPVMLGWASSSKQQLPAKIWFEFHHAVRAGKISFRPRQDHMGYAIDQMAKQFQFIGSNDVNCTSDSTWLTLCSASVDATLQSFSERRGCQAEYAHLGKRFRCLGLNVVEIERHHVTSLNDIQIWAPAH